MSHIISQVAGRLASRATVFWQAQRYSSSDSTNKEATPPSVEKGPVPVPPPEGLCCMSSCQNCVWLQYAEELAYYFKDGGKKAEEALNDVPDVNLKAFLKMELRMKKK